jgi:hypothetical protein
LPALGISGLWNAKTAGLFEGIREPTLEPKAAKMRRKSWGKARRPNLISGLDGNFPPENKSQRC